ncbi:MAG: hypothetical protein AAB785_03110 [Patescibacteria group bacterium]
MTRSKLIIFSLLNSAGTFIYIILVSLVMINGGKIFGQANNLWGGIIILTLFVLSALIVGLLILGRPIILYLNGLKKEGILMLIYTVSALFLLLIVISTIYILVK